MMQGKAFDCVKMKEEIHETLRREHAGKSEEQIERERREWLETSDHPLARWWRSIVAAKEAASPSPGARQR